MKIRNKHDGTTIESKSLVEDADGFCEPSIENGYLFEALIFSKLDGWEEVKEEE